MVSQSIPVISAINKRVLIVEHVLHECKNHILTITLNRPDKKNAFTQAMYRQCADILAEVSTNPDVRVVVITGAGGSFSAGNDLHDFLANQSSPEPFKHTLAFMTALLRCPVPVIAQVQGVAIGIGTTLLQHCDFVYAHSNSRFSMPFTQLGLCPEYAASQRMADIVGVRKATEWLLLAEPFDAQEAMTAGLLSGVFASDDELSAKVDKTASRLASLPKEAIRQSKQLMQDPRTQQVIDDEIVLFGELLKQQAAQEAMNAFIERRKPDPSKYC
jgi:enoyl-CoA hydratase/carnithine racemase